MLQQQEGPCSHPSKTKGLSSLCPGTDPQCDLPLSKQLSRVSETFSFIFGPMKGTNSIRCMINLISSYQLEPSPSKSLLTHTTARVAVPGEGGPEQEDTALSCRGWVDAGCAGQIRAGNSPLSCCHKSCLPALGRSRRAAAGQASCSWQGRAAQLENRTPKHFWG